MRYTLRTQLWWGQIDVTLGLASPWATANLERYKMRNTFYGSVGGSFAGSAGRLFWRWLPIDILAVSTIDQLVVKKQLQAAVGSVAISGIAALDHVQASEATSCRAGEGLADALNVGAI